MTIRLGTQVITDGLRALYIRAAACREPRSVSKSPLDCRSSTVTPFVGVSRRDAGFRGSRHDCTPIRTRKQVRVKSLATCSRSTSPIYSTFTNDCPERRQWAPTREC